MKPFAESCEQNKHAILQVLKTEFADNSNVLEIGSGTGQHAVHFAKHLPHTQWICSDRLENLDGIRQWLKEAELPNLQGPFLLDVTGEWPEFRVDAIFSANTVHIMSWPMVEAMFTGIGDVLQTGGKFCLYGPFMYAGQHTSESNAQFDDWLKARDPLSGVRDTLDLDQIAKTNGLELAADHEMPVNNRLRVWVKI
jgi:cyclopropane fatty-acyl-phospholipid synthase-like methyltransferase